MSIIILRWLTLKIFLSQIMKHIITKIQFLIVSCSTLMLLGQDFKSLTYRSVGPERGGRVTTVTGTAEEPGTFYLGASGGGVWKTKDYGTTWNNISDGYFKTPSIGAIEAVFSILALQNNLVYPNLNFKTQMKEFSITPQLELKEKELKTVMSNSFGFGGNCSTIIFSKEQ